MKRGPRLCALPSWQPWASSVVSNEKRVTRPVTGTRTGTVPLSPGRPAICNLHSDESTGCMGPDTRSRTSFPQWPENSQQPKCLVTGTAQSPYRTARPLISMDSISCDHKYRRKKQFHLYVPNRHRRLPRQLDNHSHRLRSSRYLNSEMVSSMGRIYIGYMEIPHHFT